MLAVRPGLRLQPALRLHPFGVWQEGEMFFLVHFEVCCAPAVLQSLIST